MISLIYAVLCVLVTYIGFYYGYKIGKGERIQTPVEKIKEVKESIETQKKEEQDAEAIEKEIEKFNTVLENIAAYPENQKEVE